MKVKDIIQRIQALYSKGLESDDTRLSDRHIYNKLLTTRARLLTQEARKNRKVSEWNYQTLPCIELIEVPRHQCPCVPPTGCTILRSKYKLPKPLLGVLEHTIDFVSLIDMSQILNPSTVNKVRMLKGNKYTQKSDIYFILEGYIYVVTGKSFKVIMLSGLFEDPLKVKEFKNYCEESCSDCNKCVDPLNEDFPIDLELIEPLVEMAAQELISIFNQLGVEDLTNNSADNIAEQSK